MVQQLPTAQEGQIRTCSRTTPSSEGASTCAGCEADLTDAGADAVAVAIGVQVADGVSNHCLGADVSISSDPPLPSSDIVVGPSLALETCESVSSSHLVVGPAVIVFALAGKVDQFSREMAVLFESFRDGVANCRGRQYHHDGIGAADEGIHVLRSGRLRGDAAETGQPHLVDGRGAIYGKRRNG